MAKTITQKVVFKNTATNVLYELYMDAKKHTASTGYPTRITEKEGTKFTASGGYITGKNLLLVKNKMILQTWRASEWEQEDPDSIFLLTFKQSGKDAILQMVHANLPDKHADSIKKGWTTYYWNPWKLFLAGKPVQPQVM